MTDEEIKADEQIIINEEHKIEQEEQRIEEREKKIQELEQEIQQEEQRIESKEDRIAEMATDIKDTVTEKAMKTITIKDVSKGVIGAFIGLVGHFAFAEGAHIAEHIGIVRAIVILIV